MKSLSISTVIILVFVSIAAFAQIPQDLFCNAGIRPNGYIDFSGLPTAPNFPAGNAPSAPITAILPVEGASGLTVTVTIHALQDSFGGGPVYTATGGPFSPMVCRSTRHTILWTDQPAIQSAGGRSGLVTSTQGRFGDTFTLMTGSPGPGPIGFVNSARNYSDFFEHLHPAGHHR